MNGRTIRLVLPLLFLLTAAVVRAEERPFTMGVVGGLSTPATASAYDGSAGLLFGLNTESTPEGSLEPGVDLLYHWFGSTTLLDGFGGLVTWDLSMIEISPYSVWRPFGEGTALYFKIASGLGMIHESLSSTSAFVEDGSSTTFHMMYNYGAGLRFGTFEIEGGVHSAMAEDADFDAYTLSLLYRRW